MCLYTNAGECIHKHVRLLLKPMCSLSSHFFGDRNEAGVYLLRFNNRDQNIFSIILRIAQENRVLNTHIFQVQQHRGMICE